MLEYKDFNLYRDIQKRTGGELFIGVVGPVRTGKSTFVRWLSRQWKKIIRVSLQMSCLSAAKER